MQAFLNWLDDYTDGIQVFVHNHIVLAPLFFLLVEEMGVPLPVPGDAIIAYVGYGLSKTHAAALWEALIIALVAVLIGATVLFHLSRQYGQTVIRWLGHFVFLKQSHVARAEKLFERYGVWAIIFGRHIPGMRIPITIFAASSGISYRTFILSTFVSTVGWILFYLEVGSHFGGDFQALFRRDTGIAIGVFAALVATFIALHVVGLYRERSKRIKSGKG
ncbi:MAG TPA: DedA family protein [Verrucomicrobiae bacterium]|nr:DedA family protein [Verrucomicrobiae bacterium]